MQTAPGSNGPETRKAGEADLVVFTLDRGTGSIVRIEGVDPAGKRHDLSVEERAFLAEREPRTLESVFEQAFEAGIACMLGDEAADDEPAGADADSDDEAELRRMLLRPLIRHSPARRLMESEALRHAILGTLIKQASGPAAAAPDASRN
jgi:hypothetical protein